MIHRDKHRWYHTDKTLKDGRSVHIVDWFDRHTKRSWMFSKGDPRATRYAIHAAQTKIRYDNLVLLAVDPQGNEFLVHESEVMA